MTDLQSKESRKKGSIPLGGSFSSGGVLKNKAIIQRCQWHKRENVVAYLSKAEQPRFCARLQKAYDRPTYEESKGEIKKLLKELKDSNQSAAASPEEGFGGNSDQRQRWIATSLLEIEPKLRKIMGHKHLPEFRKQMKNFNPKS